MSIDIASLSIKVDSTEAVKSERDLKKLADTGSDLDKTLKNTGNTSSSMFSGATSAIAPFFGAMLTGTSIIAGVGYALSSIKDEMDQWDKFLRDTAINYSTGVAAAYGFTSELKKQTDVIRENYEGMERLVKESDSLQVTKAKMAALGPEFRSMLRGEIDSYDDLYKAVKKLNEEQERMLNKQIEVEEKAKKKGSTFGNILSATGFAYGNQAIAYFGLVKQIEFLGDKESKLNDLYSARAKVMQALSNYNKPDKKPTKQEVFMDPGVHTNTLAFRDIVDGKSGIKLLPEHTVKEFSVASTGAIEFNQSLDKLRGTLQSFDSVQGWADPLAAGIERLKKDRADLDANEARLGAEGYRKGLEVLRMDLMKLKAQNGDTWAIIGQVVTQNAGRASDSMVDWMNNLDGVGRTWKTLGDTVRSVISDMLIQMQRAIVQQKLMEPLMNGFSAALGTMGDGGGWASWAAAFGKAWGGAKATGGSVYGGTSYLVGEMGPEIFTPGVTGNITPNHALGGTVENRTTITVNINGATGDTKTSVQTGGAMAEGLKQVVDGYMMAFVARESRQGGALARS